MKRDPAFLFYDGDAARDVSHMNRLERGAYFDLIQAQRKFGGFTVEQIRKILGKDFEDVWGSIEIILSKDESTGIYFIEWVKDSINERSEFAKKQKKRIQDYWDKKKKEGDLEIPWNNQGNTVVLPKIEDEDVNKDEDVNNIKEGVIGEDEICKEVNQTWRTSYEIYKSELDVIYNKLIEDSNYIKEQEELNPGVDIILSLKKAYTNFWSKQVGWQYKKKKKSKTIDWTSTLTNAIDMNKVYKSRNNGSHLAINQQKGVPVFREEF